MSELNALVVEDSIAMRQIISDAVSSIEGVEVTQAGNGVEALKLLSVKRFDIMISDINMPLMDGLKLVGMVRKGKIQTEIPIIILTTESGQEDRRRAVSLGANAYFTKPLHAPQVIAKVKTLLDLD